MYHVKTLAHMLIVRCLHDYIPHDARELYILFKNQHDVIIAVDNIVARFNSVDIICIYILADIVITQLYNVVGVQ
jgi:hypothetical protein